MAPWVGFVLYGSILVGIICVGWLGAHIVGWFAATNLRLGILVSVITVAVVGATIACAASPMKGL